MAIESFATGTPAFLKRPVNERVLLFIAAQRRVPTLSPAGYFSPQELEFFGWKAPGAEGADLNRFRTSQGYVAPKPGAAPAAPAAPEAPAAPPPIDLGALFGSGASGSSGGTVIAPASTPAGPQNPRNPDEARAYIREHYGAYSWLLDHEEIGNILIWAAVQGWPDDRIQSHLQTTDWWKTTTDAQRKWDALSHTNPGEAGRQLNAAAITTGGLFRSYGLPVENNNRILELTAAAMRNGWTDQELKRAVVSEVHWNPQTGAQGVLGDRTVQVAQAASDYAVPLSTESAFGLARQIEMGDIAPEAVTDQFRDQASVLFPHLSARIQSGATVRQIAEPYVQTAAQLLEKDASQIDIANPIYSRALSFNDGGAVREMSLNEWRQNLMADQTYGWDLTRNAREAAVGLTSQLAGMFGVR